MGAKEKILELLKSRVGKEVLRSEIIEAVGTSEWGRRVRDLRHEGWQIEPTKDGYRLKSAKKVEARDTRVINQKLRFKIIQAANGACLNCGATVIEGAKLVVDHKIPLTWGGKTEEENLWAICTTCNQGKRDHYSDADADKMRAVMGIASAKGRILEYFRLSVGKKVGKETLMLVARKSEWARRVRDLRAEGWDIVSHFEDPNLRPGQYILRSDRKRSS